jgi:hypothetical protein
MAFGVVDQRGGAVLPETIPAWVGDIALIPILAGMLYGLFRIISSGLLVPRSTVELLIAANDKVVAAKDKTIESQERQIAAMLDVNETTKHALESLKEAGERQSQGSVGGTA